MGTYQLEIVGTASSVFLSGTFPGTKQKTTKMPLNDALAEVRIEIDKDNPRDVKLIVNGRDMPDVYSYRIEHSADEVQPLVTFVMAPRFGVLFTATKARLQYEHTACQSCGFTHRQALLPLSETDYAAINAHLETLRETGSDEYQPWGEAVKYLETLLRDIRTTLDAFSPGYADDSRGVFEAVPVQTDIQNEVYRGRPNAGAAATPPGVDIAREALTRLRERTSEEESAAVGDQADARSSRPTGQGNRTDPGGIESPTNLNSQYTYQDEGEGAED